MTETPLILKDLTKQEKDIWDAGREIYALPRRYRLDCESVITLLRETLDNALTSNIVYGDFDMADGYLATLRGQLAQAKRDALEGGYV